MESIKPGWHAEESVCHACNLIAAELRAYGEQRAGEERERCCKDVCLYCAEGQPVKLSMLEYWIHPSSEGRPPYNVKCKAQAIRAAIRRRT